MPSNRPARSRRQQSRPARVEPVEPRLLLSGTVLLNEIEANDPGQTDNRFEYVELAGTPGLALTNDWFVAFDGTYGPPSKIGVADLAVNLSSYSLGTDGLLEIQSSSVSGHPVPSGTTLVPDSSYFTQTGGFPNGTLSFYLFNSPGAPFVAGTNYDPGATGTLGNLPSGAVAIDHVAIPDTNNSKDVIYGGVDVAENPSLNKGTADAVTRFPGNTAVNSAAWYGGELVDTNNVDSQLQYDVTRESTNEPANAWLTPGAVNDTPLFNAASYSFALTKPAAVGATVGTVLATPVGTDTETYALTGTGSSNFWVSAAGKITLAANASAGTYTLTVSATDNQTAVASSAPVKIVVSQTGSSVAIASNNSAASYGQPITFTATVSPTATVTGTVQFLVDGSDDGVAVPLSAGVATITTSTLAAGSHTVSAIYGGDGNYTGSAQAVLQNVSSAAVTISTPAVCLKLDTNTAYVDVWSNNTASGSPTRQLLMSSVKSITTQSGDTVVDFSAGDPVPTGGLNVAGGAVAVVGSAGNDTVTAATGSITVDGSAITTPGVTGVSFAPGTGTDSVSVTSGQLTLLPTAGAGPNPVMNFSSISISQSALLKIAQATPQAVLITAGLTIAGTAGSPLGTLDLDGNDMIVRGGILGTVTAQVAAGYDLAAGGSWAGTGITSSAAAEDSTHLSALGVVQNNQNGGPLFTAANPFDGVTPNASDVLIKSTLFGDANLDGVVDGSDYTLIDGAVGNTATGWLHGDFNYDQTIDGSDYALIDNAFNNQPAAAVAAVRLAASAVRLAPASVVSAETRAPKIRPKPSAGTVLFSGAANPPVDATAAIADWDKLKKSRQLLAVKPQNPTDL
jgi:hypothetical protein